MVSVRPSLVQQKRQQWEREREEMSHLYLPWGSGERYNRLQVRNQFASSLDLHHDCPETIQRQRSPSLPPIHHLEQEERKPKEVINRNIPSAKRFAFYDEDGEGDTSGYGSETINHRHLREGVVSDANRSPVLAWQQGSKDDNSMNRLDTRDVRDGRWSRSPRSTSGEEGRLRWGDRGVATGRLWEPTAPTERLPQMQNQKKGTPSWVERGLNMIDSTDVLVIDQRSPPSGLDCDRSSCHGSDEGRSFLRGQNVPIEPEIKAQRETKRMKALELQSAILSQLEDREKRKQEERDRIRHEERMEELRIQRQQEADRLRLEEEKRRSEEKQQLEQRKLDTLKKALEDAENKAKQEKEKRFISYRQTFNSNISNDVKKTVESTNEASTRTESVTPTKSNRTYDVHSARSTKRDSQQTTEFNSPRASAVGPGGLNLFIHSVPPLALNDNSFNIVPIGINPNGEMVNRQQNGIQLAVLVPQNMPNNMYNLSLNSLNSFNELSEPDKILTPRKYRSFRTKDASTQTELNYTKTTTDKEVETEIIELERNIDKSYPSIDENAPQESHQNTLKKDRRFRSEERYKKDLENRPKWGVNRPAAQYKKQSEKDPFYSQKRKIRQKYRPQARQYLSQSSEDSRSPSPPTRSEKTDSNNKARNSISQSYWRNKRSSHDYSRSNNHNEYESISNIASEFNNLGQVTVNEITEQKISPKMSPGKRMTLSQKFINDKYGNRKLWVDDVGDRKHSIFDGDNRKKIIDQINTAMKQRNDEDNVVVKTKF